MGIFDTPAEVTPLSEAVEIGQTFNLTAASIVRGVKSIHGTADMVLLTVDGKSYCAFGVHLVRQIESMEDGDLPCDVKLANTALSKGRTMKVLVPPDTKLVKGFIVGE